jgi:taurine dioxygenase
MWDNRCTSHVALPDFDQTRTRHMMRCSLIGEEVGRYLEHDVSTDKEEALMRAVAAIS